MNTNTHPEKTSARQQQLTSAPYDNSNQMKEEVVMTTVPNTCSVCGVDILCDWEMDHGGNDVCHDCDIPTNSCAECGEANR